MFDTDTVFLMEKYQQILEKNSIFYSWIDSEILKEDLSVKKFFKGIKNPLIASDSFKIDPDDSIARHNAKVEMLNIFKDNDALNWDTINAVEAFYISDLESYLWNVGEKRSPEEIERDHEYDHKKDEFEPVKKTLFDWVIQEHPPVDNIRLAGYILPDGTMLNFSHNGSSRDQDHREIRWPGSVGGTEKMIAFMNAGAMRIDVSSGSIHLRVAPTPQQEKAIYKISNIKNGMLYIDCEIPDESGYSYSDRINIQPSDEFEVEKAVKKIRRFFSKIN